MEKMFSQLKSFKCDNLMKNSICIVQMRTISKSFMKLGCHAFIMIRSIEQFLAEKFCSIRLKYHNLPISGRNTILEG